MSIFKSAKTVTKIIINFCLTIKIRQPLHVEICKKEKDRRGRREELKISMIKYEKARRGGLDGYWRSKLSRILASRNHTGAVKFDAISMRKTWSRDVGVHPAGVISGRKFARSMYSIAGSLASSDRWDRDEIFRAICARLNVNLSTIGSDSVVCMFARPYADPRS